MTQRPFIYAIMPVSSDPDFKEKRAELSAIGDQLQVDFHFPLDHLPTHSANFDLPETLESLSAALGVLADLSLERPSCYYERTFADMRQYRSLVMETIRSFLGENHVRVDANGSPEPDGHTPRP